MRRTARHGGQATVELVAVLPAMAVLALAAWWLVACSAAWLQAGGAARAGARAAGVGEDPAPLVRAAAPAAVARTDPSRPGRIELRLPSPPLPWAGRVPLTVTAEVVTR
ncbi:MAG: hypothetical protein IT200_03650 [Thermoleophilia bacterium]|nr:hypothetical protein [Thermoleophilia bacterium]